MTRAVPHSVSVGPLGGRRPLSSKSEAWRSAASSPSSAHAGPACVACRSASSAWRSPSSAPSPPSGCSSGEGGGRIASVGSGGSFTCIVCGSTTRAFSHFSSCRCNRAQRRLAERERLRSRHTRRAGCSGARRRRRRSGGGGRAGGERARTLPAMCISNEICGRRLKPTRTLRSFATPREPSSELRQHCTWPSSCSLLTCTSSVNVTPNLRPRSVIEPLACDGGGDHETRHSESSAHERHLGRCVGRGRQPQLADLHLAHALDLADAAAQPLGELGDLVHRGPAEEPVARVAHDRAPPFSVSVSRCTPPARRTIEELLPPSPPARRLRDATVSGGVAMSRRRCQERWSAGMAAVAAANTDGVFILCRWPAAADDAAGSSIEMYWLPPPSSRVPPACAATRTATSVTRCAILAWWRSTAVQPAVMVAASADGGSRAHRTRQSPWASLIGRRRPTVCALLRFSVRRSAARAASV